MTGTVEFVRSFHHDETTLRSFFFNRLLSHNIKRLDFITVEFDKFYCTVTQYQLKKAEITGHHDRGKDKYWSAACSNSGKNQFLNTIRSPLIGNDLMVPRIALQKNKSRH